MAFKFYVVWRGRQPGIYDSWDKCEAQVKQFKDAVFKGFPTLRQAEEAFEGNPKDYLKSVPGAAIKRSKLDDFRYGLFCDGGCSPNPGPSGTGLAILTYGQALDFWYGLHEPAGTNNRGELAGMLKALEYARDLLEQREINRANPALIACDSQYAINCITIWVYRWRSNGWVTGKGEPVLNAEIIDEANKIFTEIKGFIEIRKVKAHAGIFGNECADQLATRARTQRMTDWDQMTGEMKVAYQHTPRAKMKAGVMKAPLISCWL